MGGSWSSEGRDYDYNHHHKDSKHNFTIQDFQPERFAGNWWILAQTKTTWWCECNRMTSDYIYHSDKKEFDVQTKCWIGNAMVKDRRDMLMIQECDPCDWGKLKAKSVGCYTSSCDEKYKDFWIHWSDYDNYAVVGMPKKNHLWILSRTEKVSCQDIPFLMDIVKSFGHNPDNLTGSQSAVVST